MPAKIYTHVRVVAHTPFTGEGSGHESVEKNIEAVKKAAALALAEEKKCKDGADEVVLPIFVAPEGTWKKKTGAYGPDELAQVYNYLVTLSKASPDVLMFPGTVIWKLAGDASAEVLKKSFSFGDVKFLMQNMANKTKGQAVLYNSVPVLFDGKIIHNLNEQYSGKDIEDGFDYAPGAGKGKEYWSKLDKKEGVDVDGNGGPRQGSHVFLYKDLVTGLEKKQNMLQLGVETARDTAHKALHAAGKKLDIQVLLSGGMVFEPAAMITRPYGLAIHCDGNTKEWKKSGLKVFTVDEQNFIPPSTANLVCHGDDNTA
ncbi:MAG: hypothetical protein ACAI25_18030, partial [Planctomycetota bacterium]